MRSKSFSSKEEAKQSYEDFLKQQGKFSEEQIKELLEYSHPEEKWNPSHLMTPGQLREVRLGKQVRISTESYDNYLVPIPVMQQVREAAQAGVLLGRFLVQGFSAPQLEQISLALQDLLDIEDIALVHLPVQLMQERRLLARSKLPTLNKIYSFSCGNDLLSQNVLVIAPNHNAALELLSPYNRSKLTSIVPKFTKSVLTPIEISMGFLS
jgi:hypothetical protein